MSTFVCYFHVIDRKEKKYLGKFGLLASNMLGCPGDPLIHADISSAADFTKHLDSVKTNMLVNMMSLKLPFNL